MSNMQTSARWLAFGLVAGAILLLLLAVGPPYSTLALTLLVVIGVALVLHRYDPVPRPRVQPPVRTRGSLPLIWRNRLAITHGFAAAGVALLTASAYQFRPNENWDDLPLAALLLVMGGLALGGALWFAARTAYATTLPAPGAAHGPLTVRIHRGLTVGGVLLLALVAEANGQLLNLLPPIASHLQFALLVGGCVLLALGLGGLPRLPDERFWREAGLLALLTLAALAVRFFELEIHFRYLIDELSYVGVVESLQEKPNLELLRLMEAIAAFPRLYAYFINLGVDVFGRSFVGLRAASVVIGALGVPALYLLARTLFDRRTAWIAALLLAALPVHIHYSRIALSEIASPLFATLAFACLARGLLHRSASDYAAAGVLLGLTHYFHEGPRLLYTPLALVWLVGLGVLYRRVDWRGVGIAALACVLVAAPVYYTLLTGGYTLTERLNTEHIVVDMQYWSQELAVPGGPERFLRYQILTPLLMYVHVTDNSLFYRGNTALLIPLLIPAFLVGVWLCGWRWRRPGPLLLLLWVLATSAGNSLLALTATSARYVVAFPALALLAAVGIRYGAALILPEALVDARRYRRVLAALVLVLAAAQVYYYFRQHIPTYESEIRTLWGSRDAQDTVLRSLDFPAGTQIHIISVTPQQPGYLYGLLHYLRPADDLPLTILEELTDDYLLELEPGVDHAFFIAPDNHAALNALLSRRYILPPQASPNPVVGPDHEFILYYAPYLPGITE